VTRPFYSRFATFVAQETGWPVLTYDYRGNVGILSDAKRKQLPKHPLVDIDADISDWAHLDQPAALEYLLAHLRSVMVEEEKTVSGEGLLRGS
jgi:predicted alpha/beta hydrolase